MLLWVRTLDLAFGGFTLWPSKLRGRGSSWPKVMTLGLAFGGFTLCATEGSTYYIVLAIFNPFLWPLNKFGHSIPQPFDLDCHSVK
jgi:hypothetical protein